MPHSIASRTDSSMLLSVHMLYLFFLLFFLLSIPPRVSWELLAHVESLVLLWVLCNPCNWFHKVIFCGLCTLIPCLLLSAFSFFFLLKLVWNNFFVEYYLFSFFMSICYEFKTTLVLLLTKMPPKDIVLRLLVWLFAGRHGPCWHYGITRTTRTQGKCSSFTVLPRSVFEDFWTISCMHFGILVIGLQNFLQ